MIRAGAGSGLSSLPILGYCRLSGRCHHTNVPVRLEDRFEGCEEAGPCFMVLRGR